MMQYFKNPSKFLLYTRPRSGSTLFRFLLDNHPKIVCKGEAFRKGLGEKIDPDKHFNQLARKWCIKENPTWVGFKLFERHLIHHQLENWIKKFPVIFLVRNVFDRYLSENLVASNPDRRGEVYQNPTHIPVDNLLNQLKWEEQAIQKMRSILKSVNYIEIHYETWRSEYKRCLEFLNVEYIDPIISTTQQKIAPQSTLISNYEEVSKKLKGTKWQKFLQ